MSVRERGHPEERSSAGMLVGVRDGEYGLQVDVRVSHPAHVEEVLDENGAPLRWPEGRPVLREVPAWTQVRTLPMQHLEVRTADGWAGLSAVAAAQLDRMVEALGGISGTHVGGGAVDVQGISAAGDGTLQATVVAAGSGTLRVALEQLRVEATPWFSVQGELAGRGAPPADGPYATRRLGWESGYVHVSAFHGRRGGAFLVVSGPGLDGWGATDPPFVTDAVFLQARRFLAMGEQPPHAVVRLRRGVEPHEVYVRAGNGAEHGFSLSGYRQRFMGRAALERWLGASLDTLGGVVPVRRPDWMVPARAQPLPGPATVEHGDGRRWTVRVERTTRGDVMVVAPQRGPAGAGARDGRGMDMPLDLLLQTTRGLQTPPVSVVELHPLTQRHTLREAATGFRQISKQLGDAAVSKLVNSPMPRLYQPPARVAQSGGAAGPVL